MIADFKNRSSGYDPALVKVGRASSRAVPLYGERLRRMHVHPIHSRLPSWTALARIASACLYVVQTCPKSAPPLDPFRSISPYFASTSPGGYCPERARTAIPGHRRGSRRESTQINPLRPKNKPKTDRNRPKNFSFLPDP
jgi:hypothetical protein